MRVVFRADSSIDMGTGHVLRCLTLAQTLRLHGARCLFLCRTHKGHLCDVIQDKGFDVLPMVVRSPCKSSDPQSWLGVTWQEDLKDSLEMVQGQSVDWVIVDHYGLDERWERGMAGIARHILVIDDLADRPHHCSVLLDQNLNRCATDYASLVPQQSLRLIGPEYALLRPEFRQGHLQALQEKPQRHAKTLLISMGGVDKDNMTGELVRRLSNMALFSPQTMQKELDLQAGQGVADKTTHMQTPVMIRVVVGSACPWTDTLQLQIQALQNDMCIELVIAPKNMATLMAQSDVAIGAGGGTALERCALGVPSLVLTLAKNQELGAKALQLNGAAALCDLQKPHQLEDQLHDFFIGDTAFTLRRDMRESGLGLVDADGAARVARVLDLVKTKADRLCL